MTEKLFYSIAKMLKIRGVQEPHKEPPMCGKPRQLNPVIPETNLPNRNSAPNPDSPVISIHDSDLLAKLKSWRSSKAKEESIRPYLILSDVVLEAVVKSNPKTLEELQKVQGFGGEGIKLGLYGDQIISIMKNQN